MNPLDWYSGEPMTKRELLAAIIMSGCDRVWNEIGEQEIKKAASRVADRAVMQADILIERCKRP